MRRTRLGLAPWDDGECRSEIVWQARATLMPAVCVIRVAAAYVRADDGALEGRQVADHCHHETVCL